MNQHPSIRSVLMSSSAVLVAHDINLSIFTPAWLLNKGILTDDEFGESSRFTPGLVLISSSKQELSILPDRIILRFPWNRKEDILPTVTRIIGSIVSTLPETPYTAIGFNFEYVCAPSPEVKFADWCLCNFQSSSSKQFAKDNESRYGSYFSFNSLEMLVKVDCKPVRLSDEIEKVGNTFSPNEEAMQTTINFHRELPIDNASAIILESVGRWNDASYLAKTITEGL